MQPRSFQLAYFIVYCIMQQVSEAFCEPLATL